MLSLLCSTITTIRTSTVPSTSAGPRLPGVSRKHPALVAKGVEECWDLGAQECVADVLLPWLDHYRLNCLDEPWSRDPKI